MDGSREVAKLEPLGTLWKGFSFKLQEAARESIDRIMRKDARDVHLLYVGDDGASVRFSDVLHHWHASDLILTWVCATRWITRRPGIRNLILSLLRRHNALPIERARLGGKYFHRRRVVRRIMRDEESAAVILHELGDHCLSFQLDWIVPLIEKSMQDDRPVVCGWAMHAMAEILRCHGYRGKIDYREIATINYQHDNLAVREAASILKLAVERFSSTP